MPVPTTLPPITHTALPWSVATRSGGMLELVSGEKDIACFWPRNGDDASRAVNEANVRLACRAVNCHAELLAACREFVALYDGVRDAIGQSVREKLARAEAAIAKAVTS